MQGCRKLVFRYACAGFRRLFSRKTVSHAPHGWRFGECAGGKGEKMRVVRWTARKMNGNHLLEYSILNSISLPKPLPVCFRFVIGNESDSAALLLLLGLAQKLRQCLIDVVELRIGAGFQFLNAFQQFFIPCDHLTHKDKCPHNGNIHFDGGLATQYG